MGLKSSSGSPNFYYSCRDMTKYHVFLNIFVVLKHTHTHIVQIYFYLGGLYLVAALVRYKEISLLFVGLKFDFLLHFFFKLDWPMNQTHGSAKDV